VSRMRKVVLTGLKVVLAGVVAFLAAMAVVSGQERGSVPGPTATSPAAGKERVAVLESVLGQLWAVLNKARAPAQRAAWSTSRAAPFGWGACRGIGGAEMTKSRGIR